MALHEGVNIVQRKGGLLRLVDKSQVHLCCLKSFSLITSSVATFEIWLSVAGT